MSEVVVSHQYIYIYISHQYIIYIYLYGGNLEQWWRSNVESQTETNRETKALNTKWRERERDVFFFWLVLEKRTEYNK